MNNTKVTGKSIKAKVNINDPDTAKEELSNKLHGVQ